MEKNFERWLVKEVEKKGGVAIKLDPTYYRGIPDRLILLPGGKTIFVELKYGTNKLTPHQKFWQRLLRMMGFKVLEVRDDYDRKEIRRSLFERED